MANSAEVDKSIYFVPESGWYPVFLAFGLMLTVTGLAGWLMDLRLYALECPNLNRG